MSLECTNKELPTCPNCHRQIEDALTLFADYPFHATQIHYMCEGCGEQIKITVKRLYDTEVVR